LPHGPQHGSRPALLPIARRLQWIQAADILGITSIILVSIVILGGIPCYLEAFNEQVNITQNMARNILRMGSFLKDETQNLLKMCLKKSVPNT
jgi:hypothetical protein